MIYFRLRRGVQESHPVSSVSTSTDNRVSWSQSRPVHSPLNPRLFVKQVEWMGEGDITRYLLRKDWEENSGHPID